MNDTYPVCVDVGLTNIKENNSALSKLFGSIDVMSVINTGRM